MAKLKPCSFCEDSDIFESVLLRTVLYTLITAILIYATQMPWWVCLLMFIVIVCTDFISLMLSVAILIYAFCVTLRQPITQFSIVFFIDAVIYVIFILVPTITEVIRTRKERTDED